MSLKKPKFYRAGAVFIHPDDCGSSIRWMVKYTSSGRRVADVELRDCDRQISWGGYGEDCIPVMRQKLHTAISQMEKCLLALRQMEVAHPRRKKRRAAR